VITTPLLKKCGKNLEKKWGSVENMLIALPSSPLDLCG